jgi:hypothetical protein
MRCGGLLVTRTKIECKSREGRWEVSRSSARFPEKCYSTVTDFARFLGRSTVTLRRTPA